MTRGAYSNAKSRRWHELDMQSMSQVHAEDWAALPPEIRLELR